MPKVPKRPVNYRGMEQLSQSCGTCRHYIPEYADQDHDQDDATGCELVAGAIDGDFVCDLFKKVDLDNIEPGYDWDKPAQVAPLDMSALPSAWGTSDVAKSDGFNIAKTDDAERLVFGWASVSTNADDSELVDHHADIIEPAELEKAAYEYVLKFRDAGEMHQGHAVGQLVESLVMTPDKARAMGIPVPMGTRWWVGYKIHDPEVFAKVKDGTYKMFSIQGTAERE